MFEFIAELVGAGSIKPMAQLKQLSFQPLDFEAHVIFPPPLPPKCWFIGETASVGVYWRTSLFSLLAYFLRSFAEAGSSSVMRRDEEKRDIDKEAVKDASLGDFPLRGWTPGIKGLHWAIKDVSQLLGLPMFMQVTIALWDWL